MEETDARPGGTDCTGKECGGSEDLTCKAIELGAGIREKSLVFWKGKEAIDYGEEFRHCWKCSEYVCSQSAYAGGIGRVKCCA